MRRAVARFLLATLLALVPAVIGAGMAVLYSRPGTLLLGRTAAEELGSRMRGRFSIARIDGTFRRDVVLERLEIRDTNGVLLADIPRLQLHYGLANLLAGRFVFDHVEMDQPRIQIIKRKNGRLNLHEIFKLGESPPSGLPGPLVEFRDIRIRRGTLELRLPWNPPDTAATAALVAAALAADRERPGRVILETPEGLRRVVTFDALNSRVSRLLVSSPDRTPLTFDIDSLATRVSDPAIAIVDLAAHGWTRADTLQFTLHRAALPGTKVAGQGFVTWPHGPLLYDFTLNASRVDLRDLRWISPNFPAMTGRGRVIAKWRTDRTAGYDLRDLALQGGPGDVAGNVVVVLDEHRGLGVEHMALRLRALDLDVPRPYLDTLPLHGTLTGTLAGDGYLDGLNVDYDGRFDDAQVPGGASNAVSVAGHLVFGGPEGTLLDSLEVRSADLDLATVRLQAPSVELAGRLGMVGVLEGPWRNLTFRGTASHRDADRPASRATGRARLDTRDSAATAFDVDVRLEPLAFDGVRGSYPRLAMRGSYNGTIQLEGTTARFRLATTGQGEIGQLAGGGTLTRSPSGFGTDSLLLDFRDLDLAAIRGVETPVTRLNGRLLARGVYDSVSGPKGALSIWGSRTNLAGLPLDTLLVSVHAEDSLITLDTLQAAWRAGQLAGGGRLGWRRLGDDALTFGFRADSLAVLDPALARLLDLAPDTARAPLAGSASGDITLAGSTDHPRAVLHARGQKVEWSGMRWPAVAGGAAWNGGVRPELNAVIAADTMAIGTWTATGLNLVLGGFADSLNWFGDTRLGVGVPLAAGGRFWTTGTDPMLVMDSLRLSLPERAWYLVNPLDVTLARDRFDLTPLRFAPRDGSGGLTISGSLPREGAGTLTLDGFGLPLTELYQALGLDTTGVAGSLQFDLTVGGTARAPTIRGVAALADLSFGDLGSPFVQGVIDYADHQLESSLLLWRTGEPVLRIESRLPLDLALASVPRRQLDGPILVRAVADSTDLAVAEAFTRNLRRVRGILRANVEINGTWTEPRLGGQIAVQNASAVVPGLGVRYQGLSARAHLSGDSILVDSFTVRSGEGNLTVEGGLRLERLSRPVLDLTLRASRFRAIDVRTFLSLDGTGQLRLRGPFWQARLSGALTADRGDLHFADLVTKRIVDLENPGDSGLIDIAAVREQRLGTNVQNRFLDSLSVDGLRLTMGQNFWLRSSEANIQLDGTLTVNKVRQAYRYDGTLNTTRGNYNLRIGPVTRDFTVEKGTVQYFGTPDLNADLDIQARHTVISTDVVNRGEEVPVIAKITGTLLQPKLSLESTQRPPLSETELVSYLVYGRPSFSLQGSAQGDNPAVQALMSYLSSALSSEIQRTLISDLGVPIDYIDIRPGQVGANSAAGQGTSAQVAQVYAGWQIGRDWFVTVVADLCTNTQRLYPSAEYRISRQFRLKGSVEPAYSCQTLAGQPSFSAQKYQVGLDFLWEREY
jgi:translocation and assembly module TamB